MGQNALEALTRLTHRGAQDADAETSDGAGLLTQIPRAIFCAEIQAQGITVPDPEDLAVGMLFLPSQDRYTAEYVQSRQIIEQTLHEVGLRITHQHSKGKSDAKGRHSACGLERAGLHLPGA
jgi:glutamate synthase domain-containing protein 1